MNFLGTNWKTTAGGLATAIFGLSSLLGIHIVGQQPVPPDVALGMITGGLALVFAKDNNVTGGNKPQ